jgi:hypothetical protein
MQRAETLTHIQRLEKARRELPEDQLYNQMSLDLRLLQLNTVLEWLEEYQRVILYP